MRALIKKTTMEGAKTIKTENGEIYVKGDTIVGRMETKGNETKYYKGDKLHREGDLPASIMRNKAGVVTLEEYYRDGKYHRDGDRPAYIMRNKAGVVTLEEYYRDSKYHRDGDRPAVIVRNKAGVATYENYYRDGVNITADQIKAEKLTAMKAELDAANAKNVELQAQLDQLKANIKAALE